MAGGAPDPVADLVRAADFDAYAAALFAPAPARPHLLALHAFAIETGRVRDLVSEPMPGELRLQWWRDAIEDPDRADAAAHPVARGLSAAIAYGRLPRAALQDVIDARAEDLYDDPVASAGDLERRLGATTSAILRLACLVAAGGRDPGGADSAGHAGVALGTVRLLQNFPRHAARGQILLPADLMAGHSVDRDDVASGRATVGLVDALADLRDLARRHLAQARSAFGAMDPVAAAAFLPVALVAGDMARLDRAAATPFAVPAPAPRWRRLAALWRASRRSPPF